MVRWIAAHPAGHQFNSRTVSKVLDLMPYDVGRIAGILAEEGKLRVAGKERNGSTLWEVVSP